MFIQWIYNSRGTSPKTWAVLIKALKSIELIKAAEEISEKLFAKI